SIAASTRARVAGETSGRPLRTLDTVGTDTPASRAIAAIVVGAPLLTVGPPSRNFRAITVASRFRAARADLRAVRERWSGGPRAQVGRRAGPRPGAVPTARDALRRAVPIVSWGATSGP